MGLLDTRKTAAPDDDILGVEPPGQAEQPAAAVQVATSDAVPNEDAQVQPDYGSAMSACTPRERKFVLYHFQPDTSDAQAARLAGYGHEGSNANTMARIAFRLTHENSRVVAAIEEVAKTAVRALSTDAVKALKQIVTQPYHKDQARVALAIAERIDPTVQRVEGKFEHTHKIDHEAEALNQLRSLMALGVAREKLIEVFGQFGLERLEAKLETKPVIAVEYREIGQGE